MSKTRTVFLLASTAIILSSCGPSEKLTRVTYSSSESSSSSSDESIVSSKVDESSIEDITSVESEESSIPSSSSSKQLLVSDLKEEDYPSIPELFVSKLEKYKTYKAVTSGNTKSSFLGMEVDQSIDADAIKGEYSYLLNHSHSNFVDTYHQAYFHNGKALWRDSREGEFTLKEMNEYLDVYGVYPFEHALEGYDIRGENVLGVVKEEDTSNFTFKISLNTETSGTNVRIQMKQFGGLDDYPKFKRIDIYITIKDDFTPISLKMDSEYSAKKILETDCHQQYTVTYSSFDEEIELPDKANIDHEGF